MRMLITLCGVNGKMTLRHWMVQNHVMPVLGNYVIMLQPFAACWQFFKFWWISGPGTTKKPSDTKNTIVSLHSFVKFHYFCTAANASGILKEISRKIIKAMRNRSELKFILDIERRWCRKISCGSRAARSRCPLRGKKERRRAGR